MKQFEYKHIRLDYKGRGITQEINILDIDGERIRGWGDSSEVPTLLHSLIKAFKSLFFLALIFVNGWSGDKTKYEVPAKINSKLERILLEYNDH